MKQVVEIKGVCSDCPFWDQKAYKPFGYCRVDAPQKGETDGGEWPITGPDAWCGRHYLRDAHWKLKAQDALGQLVKARLVATAQEEGPQGETARGFTDAEFEAVFGEPRPKPPMPSDDHGVRVR